MIDSPGMILAIVKRAAKSQLGITITSRIDGGGHLIFWANENNLSGSSAKRLVELLSKQLTNEFKLDLKRIINEDKMYKANSIHDLNSKKIFGEKYGGFVSAASTSSTTSAASNSSWK